MLWPIAIGGFVLSFAFDLVGIIYASPGPNPLHQLAYYTMIAGILGALAAALPHIADLVALPSGMERRTELADTEINLTVIALYIVNAWMRHDAPQDLSFPMLLSLAGVIVLLASGWLEDKMVFKGA